MKPLSYWEELLIRVDVELKNLRTNPSWGLPLPMAPRRPKWVREVRTKNGALDVRYVRCPAYVYRKRYKAWRKVQMERSGLQRRHQKAEARRLYILGRIKALTPTFWERLSDGLL